jgi:hypothetical protein
LRGYYSAIVQHRVDKGSMGDDNGGDGDKKNREAHFLKKSINQIEVK